MGRSKMRPQPKMPAAQATGVPDRSILALALLSGALIAMIAPSVASQSQGVDMTAAWVGTLGVVAAIALVADRSVVLQPDRLMMAWTAFLGWALVSALASGRFWASLMGEPTNMLGWFLLLATTALALAGSLYGAAFRRHLENWVWLAVLAELLWVTYGQFTTTDQSAGTFFNSTPRGGTAPTVAGGVCLRRVLQSARALPAMRRSRLRWWSLGSQARVRRFGFCLCGLSGPSLAAFACLLPTSWLRSGGYHSSPSGR